MTQNTFAFFFIVISILTTLSLSAQSDRWQQRAEYKMDIDFDVKKHQFQGEQALTYYNNSTDTLHRVFYHLYFNAFQPGSMMDLKSLNIEDPDKRVGSRISKLTPEQIGFCKVTNLTQDGNPTQFITEGTILEVTLAKPILPGKSTKFKMEFLSQVPVQIRRSGRDNKEGISYSMSQWYPKLCEYDYQGWHANPYVGREFYGIWGDFEVNIEIDRAYTVAATGTLTNAKDIGHGYSDKKTKRKKGLFRKSKLKWSFKAENVHDFVWAADPDYVHLIKETKAGTELHYFFQDNEKTNENWNRLHQAMDEAEQFMNANYGKYPYPSYAFIQGGDGGMEYPMATLITGERPYPSLVGVSIHEWMHSWYHTVLGTNESLYPWMDEGFTSFGSAEVMNHLRAKGLINGEVLAHPHYNSIRGYARFALSGKEEALSTHADHYQTNSAYGVGSYTKGTVFLCQIEYIIGDDAFYKGLRRYYSEWGFKHPNANDFIRVMEKTSGIELDWFKEYWVNTTKVIDYGIKELRTENDKTSLILNKIGQIPMPLDIEVFLENGNTKRYTIPLRIMRGEKSNDIFEGEVAKDWPWTHPEYILPLDLNRSEIKKIVIDPTDRLADVNLENNVWPIPTKQIEIEE